MEIRRMAEVFRPDEEALRHAGFGAVCHVPVLFGKTRNSPAQKHYLREFNRYLRERALLEWVPVDRTTAAQIKRLGDTKKLRYPTRCSLGSYAERLANFDDWLAETNRGWRTVEYTRDIVLGYQADMLSGRWSETGRKLTPATVKVRLAEACLFLSWAAARGYRHVFDVVHTAGTTAFRTVSLIPASEGLWCIPGRAPRRTPPNRQSRYPPPRRLRRGCPR